MRTKENKWKPADDALLRLHYPTAPRADLLTLIPGRTLTAMKNRAMVLGVVRPASNCWTAAQDALVRAEYAETPTPALAAKLGRTELAVRSRAERLGVRKSTQFLSQMGADMRKRGTPVADAKKAQKIKAQPVSTGKKWYHYPMNSPEYKAGVVALSEGRERVNMIDQYGRVATVYRRPSSIQQLVNGPK